MLSPETADGREHRARQRRLAFANGKAFSRIRTDVGSGATATYRELIGVVGFAMFVFPILLFAATVVVTAIKISLVHSWATEGTVFRAPYYYANVLRTYSPWFLAGGGMMCVPRLMGRRR